MTRLGILLCDFEDILTIGGIDVRGMRRSRIYRGRSDGEDFVGFAAFAEFGSQDLGGSMHQRHHGVGKLHRVAIFCRERSFAQRGADGVGQPRVTFAQPRRKQKLGSPADLCRQMPVEI